MALLRHPDFTKLWVGQTISEIGSRITREGLPLTAVLLLAATPAQMGLLSAIGSASVLLFGLAAGVLVDRLRRRPVMIAADLGRAVLLATIPLAAAMHRLSFTQLLIVGALAGILTVVFDVAYQSYLPVLLERDLLVEGNRRLGMSSATAEILGPGLTGVLVKLITAPIAVLLDAISFLISAISVWIIRKPEPPAAPATGIPWKQEIFEGARSIAGHPILRALAIRSMIAFLFAGLSFSLYVLYAIRTLHMSTVAFGFTIALGGAGALVGSYFADRISRRFGLGRSFFGSALLTGTVNLLIPLAATYPRFAVLFLGASQFFGDSAWAVYMVNETTLRQRVTADHMLGRVNAAMQLASRGVLPIGALLGGLLGSGIGIPATLWIGGAGLLASCLCLLPVLKFHTE